MALLPTPSSGTWDSSLWDDFGSGWDVFPQTMLAIKGVRRAERVTPGSAQRQDIARADRITPGSARRIDE